jgi:hypothetical protein
LKVALSLLRAVQVQPVWVFTVIEPGPPVAENGTIVALSGFVLYVQGPAYTNVEEEKNIAKSAASHKTCVLFINPPWVKT